MRTYLALAVFCLVAGWTSVQATQTSNVEIGEHLPLMVITVPNVVTKCYVTTPKGDVVEFKPEDKSGDKYTLTPDSALTGCQIIVNNMDKDDEGEWSITYEAEGATGTSIYIVHVQEEDERQVNNLSSQHHRTNFHNSHSIIIDKEAFSTFESCHIRTSDGQEYLLADDFNLWGMRKITNDEHVACGIIVTVNTEDAIGSWTLVSKETRFHTPIEKRLQFTIYVEEVVLANTETVTIAEGNDLHIRLEKPTDMYDTCRLLQPDGTQRDAEVDPLNSEFCGFVVRNVNMDENGTWTIAYGNTVTYVAIVNVSVNSRWQADGSSVYNWVRDSYVNITLGPQDAVYCKIEDPSGVAVVESFGVCHLSIEKVLPEHAGTWTMQVGTEGRVLTDQTTFLVVVANKETKPVVSVTVEKINPQVQLTCSVVSQKAVKACKFRDPSGSVFVVTHNVGEDRFIASHSSVQLASGLINNECGIQLVTTEVADLGLWRCGMETEDETYYGFLTVLCPWAMSVPEVAAAVVSEPVLTVDSTAVSALVGEPATISCSVQAVIRYCYFRFLNGSVFNVGPGSPEYAGQGFDAGECSARFPAMSLRDSGRWSCHVGFMDPTEPEQRVQFVVSVAEPMTVTQYRQGDKLMVEGHVYEDRAVEYCRFVRIDGTGFTNENVPTGYTSMSVLQRGLCAILIDSPTILEHHPWTVVARISGQEVEVSGYTPHTIENGGCGHNCDDTDVVDEDQDAGDDNVMIVYYRSQPALVWLLAILLIMCSIIVLFLILPKKNREWTFRRSTQIRDSFRRSIQKKPLDLNVATVENRNAAMSA